MQLRIQLVLNANRAVLWAEEQSEAALLPVKTSTFVKKMVEIGFEQGVSKRREVKSAQEVLEHVNTVRKVPTS